MDHSFIKLIDYDEEKNKKKKKKMSIQISGKFRGTFIVKMMQKMKM